MNEPFKFSPVFTNIVALGTAVVAGLMAYATAREGVEVTEEFVNNSVDKIKNRKNQKTPPPSGE